MEDRRNSKAQSSCTFCTLCNFLAYTYKDQTSYDQQSKLSLWLKCDEIAGPFSLNTSF